MGLVMSIKTRIRRLEAKSKQGGNRVFLKNLDETEEEALDRYCRENNISDAEREAHVWIALNENQARF